MTAPGFSLTAGEHRRVERVDQLVALGDAGVAELLGALDDPSWTVRRAAVAALAAQPIPGNGQGTAGRPGARDA